MGLKMDGCLRQLFDNAGARVEHQYRHECRVDVVQGKGQGGRGTEY
jgi:hypothetical protein